MSRNAPTQTRPTAKRWRDLRKASPTLIVGIGVALVAIVGLVVALTIRGGHVGTVGEWIGGLGAAAALLVAVHEISQQSRNRRAELLLQRDAAARRVWLQDHYEFLSVPGGESTDYRFEIVNDSENPVHNLWLSVAVSRTPVEQREGPVEVESIEIEPIGELTVYRGGEGGRPLERGEVEISVGTLGPGRRVSANFATQLRTMPEDIEVTWSDVWGSSRRLAISDEHTAEYTVDA